MAFSNDGRYLLSVSRDRSWSLFQIDETSLSKEKIFFISFSFVDLQAQLYKRISSNNAYHKRIIWTCNFSHDDQYFATGSRDQIVHLWRVNEKNADEIEQPCEKNVLKLNDSVTAVTFASRLIDNDKFVPISLLLYDQIIFFPNNLDISSPLAWIMVLFFSIPGMSKYPGNC